MKHDVRGDNLNYPESKFVPKFSLAFILAIKDINKQGIAYLVHFFLLCVFLPSEPIPYEF